MLKSGQRMISRRDRNLSCQRPDSYNQDRDVEACGDTDSRIMAKEFDSLFPLYLIITEEDINRAMRLRNRSESLLFTKWASNLTPHIEQERQLKDRSHHNNDVSTRHRRRATRKQDPILSDHVPRNIPRLCPAMHVMPLAYQPLRGGDGMTHLSSPGPAHFSVSIGWPPSPYRQRNTKKKRDKTFVNDLRFKL